MVKMNVTIISGLRAEGFDVQIFKDNEEIFSESYAYGYNASYNKNFADCAKADFENAQKHHWTSSYYRLKPYTSDILSELAKEYTVDFISVEGSISVFSGNPMPREKIDNFIQTYIYPEASLHNLVNSEDNINK